MADKQALNATFFAFKKRERSGVLLGASVTYALIMIVACGAFVALNWQAAIDYMSWITTMTQAGAQPNPNDPFAGVMPPQSVVNLGASYFLFLIVIYLLLAAYEAACLRWMIRGETKGLFGLALDADTWRVYFTYWIWFFLLMAMYLVVGMVILGTVAGAAVGAQGNPDALGAMGPVVFLLALAVIVLVVYFGVRFAPAAATSVAKRRFAFFDAWTVTKGRFWALLGSFVLLWLMYIVGVIILSTIASFAMVGGMMSQAQTGAEATTPEQAFAIFASPSVWIPLAIMYGLMIVGAFVFYVALFGVNARAAVAALEEGKIAAAQA
ncbi:MAG: hypothetical protein AB7H66_12630 [Hyphomonadaceae bacterium]